MINLPNTTRLRGLGLPAIKGSQGYFAPKKQYDSAWSDLLMALFTAPNSRPLKRSLGSRLRDLLFAPVNDIDGQVIQYVVKETVERNCPHLTVHGTNLKPDEKGIYIEVIFSLTSDTAQPVRRSTLIPKSYISG
jgi:phage baseplate assembly protein W